MTRWGGTAPGLPQLRLALVVALVAFQSAEVSESWISVMGTPLWIVQVLALPALFVATGFLLASSRARNPIRTIIIRRARNVLPTVFIVVSATVFIAGPLATNLSLRSYLLNPQSWAYFANLLAIPVYELPGVFEFNNVANIVNSLVVIFPLYGVLVATAIALPRNNERRTKLLLGALLLIAVSAALAGQALDALPRDARNIVRFALAGPGLGMLLCGWLGMSIYWFRTRIKLSLGTLVATGLFLAAISLVGNSSWSASPFFWIILTPVVAYLVIHVSMLRLPFARLAVRLQPLLFPLFLSAYPLQQLVIDRGPANQSFVVNFGIVAIPLFAAAALSWYLVTRRIGSASNQIDIELQLAAVPPEEQLGRPRRRLSSRLRSALVPLALSTAIGLAAVLAMAMLFLAMSRES